MPYSNRVMQKNQQLNASKILCVASFRQRITAVIILFAIAVSFGLLKLAADGIINLNFWFGPCGFKQDYDLPCPTCGMTTSALAFVQGRFFDSFWIQPACHLLCCLLVIAAFFSFFTAVFGLNFAFFNQFYTKIKIKYIILGLIIIVFAGWAVTLARAIAARSFG